MSAAEPADHTMPVPYGDRGEQAAVIDLSARRPGKGRRKPVSTPQPATPDPAAGGPTPLDKLAEHFEIVFNRSRLTLTDEDSATAYRITLDLVRDIILRGAEAQAIIDGGQRLKLDELVKGIRSAPELVERSV
jgi:hypothetical protein